MSRQINKVISSLLAIIFTATVLPDNAIALRPMAYRLESGLSARMPENSYPADYDKKIGYFKAWLDDIKTKDLTKETQILHILNLLVASLKNIGLSIKEKDTGHASFSQAKAAAAIKSLAMTGLIDKKMISESLLTWLADSLKSSGPYIKLETAYIVKGLADAGLFDKEMISKGILTCLIANLENDSMSIQLSAADAILSLINAGLSDNGKLKYEIPLDKIIANLKSSSSRRQLNAAIVLKTLAQAGLLDIEMARRDIPLNQLIENLHISSAYRQAGAAEAIRYLSDVGLFDRKKFAQGFRVKRLTANLESKDSSAQLYVSAALKDLIDSGLLQKKQMRKQISLTQLTANLNSSDSTTLLHTATAIKSLTDAGLLDSKDLKQQVHLSHIINNLQSSNLYTVSRTANAVKFLSDVDLLNKDELKKYINLNPLITNFKNKILDRYTETTMAVEALIAAGLLDKEMISGILLSQLVDSLYSTHSWIQLEAARTIEYIASADLLDKEAVKKQINLSRLTDNLTSNSSSVLSNSADALKSLAHAGVLDETRLKHNISLSQIIDNLQDNSAYTQAEAAGAIVSLSDAGLLDKERLKQIVGFIDATLHVPVGFRYYYMRLIEHLKDNAESAYRIFDYLDPTFLDISENITNRQGESYFYEWLASQIRKEASFQEIMSEYIREQIGLSSIEFKDGGNSFNSASKFAETILKQVNNLEILQAPEAFPAPEILEIQDIPAYESLEVIIPANYYLSNALGRTLIYQHSEWGNYLAFKILKQDEPVSYLDYESRMLDYLNANKEALGLKSYYPKPYLVEGSRLIRIKLNKAPNEMLQSQIDKDKRRFDLDKTDGYYTLMAYKAEGSNYFTYIRESDIEPVLFREALLINIHDLFVLARYGIIHTALIELFHNLIQNNRQDSGKYIWMIDIIQNIWGRSGAGRLHAWTSAVEYPNMRLSGLADFPDLYTLRQLAKDDNPISVHMNTLKDEHPGYSPEVFYLASYLGDYLLSAALITGRYLRDRGELDWRNPDMLAKLMQECYITAFTAFAGQGEGAIHLLSDMVDWKRFARQMCLAMAKGNELSDYLLNNDIPQEIYGPNVQIHYSSDYISSRGWIDTAKKKGWYFDGSNPDLGPTNGPNPLQELIKANYIFTAFSLSGKINNFSSVYKPTLQRNTPQIINAPPTQPVTDMKKSFFSFEYKKAIAIKQAA
jgi:hypothetical protein